MSEPTKMNAFLHKWAIQRNEFFKSPEEITEWAKDIEAAVLEEAGLRHDQFEQLRTTITELEEEARTLGKGFDGSHKDAMRYAEERDRLREMLREARSRFTLFRDAGVSMPDGWSSDQDELISEIDAVLAVKP